MKLITWNCQGAFRKKAATILSYKPDILVVQECEHPDKLVFNSELQRPNDLYWYGDSIHKGIGIFSYSEYRFELLPDFNPEFRYILPFRVTGHELTFNLIAVWAMDNKENRDARYIGQVWLAINHYTSLLNEPAILIGDFNSNKIWDRKDRVGNHSDVVRKLADNNIHSLYHQHLNSEHGREQHPTFFLHRNQNKPYHLDYCFASADFADKVLEIEIGTYHDWIAHSDHSPLKITFDRLTSERFPIPNTMASKKLKDGDQCKVIAGTHVGKSGTVRDINVSKTGHITITVEQINGVRFKTLGKNVVV